MPILHFSTSPHTYDSGGLSGYAHRCILCSLYATGTARGPKGKYQKAISFLTRLIHLSPKAYYLLADMLPAKSNEEKPIKPGENYKRHRRLYNQHCRLYKRRRRLYKRQWRL